MIRHGGQHEAGQRILFCFLSNWVFEMYGVEMLLVDAKPTPRAKRHIAARVASGQCLCCDRQAKRRGLCDHCYYEFNKLMREIPTRSGRVEFVSRLVRDGKVLVSYEVGRLKRRSVFQAYLKRG